MDYLSDFFEHNISVLENMDGKKLRFCIECEDIPSMFVLNMFPKLHWAFSGFHSPMQCFQTKGLQTWCCICDTEET